MTLQLDQVDRASFDALLDVIQALPRLQKLSLSLYGQDGEGFSFSDGQRNSV